MRHAKGSTAKQPHAPPRCHGAGLALLLIMLCRCGSWSPHPGEPVLAKVEKRVTSADFKPATVDGERWTSAVETVPAEGYPDHPPFFVEARTPELRHAPCGQCHLEGKPPKQMQTPDAGFALGPDQQGKPARSHWNIELRHAKPETMSCATCHDADARMESLHKLEGKKLVFDQSHQVCVQCHFRQGEDWAGGAHGKRVAAWAPPRIVRECVSCHNPHNPAIPKRWPATVSTRPNSKLEEEHP